MNAAAKTCLLLLGWSVAGPAAEPPVEPVTVCEIIKDPAAWEGKPVMVIGRYSFRRNGRFLGEEACGRPAAAAGEKPAAAVLWLADDSKIAPKVPLVLQMDAKTAQQKLDRVAHSTPLGRFRFGSTDYDRWAAVYGQLEKRPQRQGEVDPPPARLLIHGDGAIVFLGTE